MAIFNLAVSSNSSVSVKRMLKTLFIGSSLAQICWSRSLRIPWKFSFLPSSQRSWFPGFVQRIRNCFKNLHRGWSYICFKSKPVSAHLSNMHTLTHAHTHTHTHARTHSPTHEHLLAHSQTNTHTRVHTHMTVSLSFRSLFALTLPLEWKKVGNGECKQASSSSTCVGSITNDIHLAAIN